MTAGGEVVEDYRSRGLTLRSHPVAFFEQFLWRAATCRQPTSVEHAMGDEYQSRGSNGVLFITLEEETEIAKLIVWPSLFEKQRRLVLSARMIGCPVRCSARAKSFTSSPST